MDLTLARKIIRDSNTRFADAFEAACVITDDESATWEDLECCLDFGGLPYELAAITISLRLRDLLADK